MNIFPMEYNLPKMRIVVYMDFIFFGVKCFFSKRGPLLRIFFVLSAFIYLFIHSHLIYNWFLYYNAVHSKATVIFCLFVSLACESVTMST